MQLLLGHLHDGRQSYGDPDGIADGSGLGKQRLGRAGRGQRRAVPVDDRSALGLERDGSRVLSLGQAGQLAIADDLELTQPRGHAAEGEDEGRRQEQDARPQSGDSHGSSGDLMKPQDIGRLAVTRPPSAAACPLPPATNSRATRICWCVGTVRPS